MKSNSGFTKVLKIIFIIIEVILALRFLFKLLGIKATAPVFEWIYNISNYFVSPFAISFDAIRFGNTAFQIDVQTLFVMLAYAVIFFAVIQLVAFLSKSFGEKSSH